MSNLFLENIIYDDIKVGQTTELVKTVTNDDIMRFGYMSGDTNPVHFDKNFASNTIFKDIIIHGMWSASMISTVLGTQLPGPGAIYLGQSLKFSHAIYIGDTITIKVTVTEKQEKNKITLYCECINQNSVVVTSGDALVKATNTKISIPNIQLINSGHLSVCPI